eukprot:TRINITY_DN3087_c5_g4_i2.p1 TRINITY_DN3087_c5_g4~~TRINITY_DN3087_c5_g4_i2.p1  ORF type:complete len:1881 (+),score=335.36 TRINITY_DN3087_c5_g4_i2:109-5751(+)
MKQFTALSAALCLCLVGHGEGHDACLSSLLPFDLDLISAVERVDHREVHITGEYRLEEGAPGEFYNNATGFVEHRLKIAAGKEEGVLRVSLTHREGTEVKMMLYEGEESSVTADVNPIERMLYATLKADQQYEVLFMYRVGTKHHCPTINLELVYVYKSLIKHQTCDEDSESGYVDLDITQALLDMDPSPLDQTTHEFKEITDMEEVRFLMTYDGVLKPDELNSDSADSFVTLGKVTDKQYTEIALPHLRGMRSEWLLKISLSTDFVVGGRIGMVVTPISFKFDDCPEGQDIQTCIANTEGAFIATGNRGWWKNTMYLQALLASRPQEAGDNTIESKYKLWTFVRSEDPVKSDMCVPYHVRVALSPVAEDEDPINCDTVPLPKYLNDRPGYYDELSATLHVYQRVGIDRETGLQFTQVRPVKDSLLRIYIEHPTTAIKIILKNNDTSDLLAVAETTGNEPRGLVYALEAKTVYGIYFTESHNVVTPEIEENEWIPFCDGFLTRIEILPNDQIAPSETGVPEVPTIDFSLLQSDPYKLNFTSIMGNTDVEFSYSKKLESPYWTQQPLISWTFTVLQPSAFRLTIERDFLLGDVVASLSPVSADGDELYSVYSSNDLRTSQLDADLDEGLYRLTLMTGFVQSTESPGEMKGHPKQVEYSMDLLIASLDSTVDTICEGSRPIPDQLNLQHSVVQHLFEKFTVPQHTVHEMFFSPSDEGLLHLQISETKVPITVKIYVKRGSGWVAADEDEEEQNPAFEELYEGLPWAMFEFSKGSDYKMTLEFEESTLDCQTFTMQLSTAKLPTADGEESDECFEKLPDPKMLSNLTMPFHIEEIYTYSSDSNIPHNHINFTLVAPTEFKAIVNYNFKYQHIYLDVCSCPDETFERCHDCGSIRGEAIFDGEEIRTQLLPRGSYILKIYESTVTKAVARKPCELFTFNLWMDSVSRPNKNPLPGHNCSHQFLPKDLNVAGMLVDNEFHSMGDIRLDDARSADTTQFTITKPVVFRMWVPPSYNLPDIEIYMHLSKSPEDFEWSDILIKEGTTMLTRLDQGTYIIVLYYKYVGANMPNEEDGFFHKPGGLSCVSTPVEISIMPTRAYKDEELGEICAPYSGFPTEFPVHAHETRQRPTDKLFNEHLRFSFGEKGGRVEFDLRSTFETGSMHMHIMKEEDEGDQEKWAHYYPIRYLDRDYMYVTLGEGNYLVMILNTTDDTIAADSQGRPYSGCQKYSLHLSVEDFGSKVPETVAPGAPPNTTVAPERQTDCPLNKVFPQQVRKTFLDHMVLLEGTGYSFVQEEELTPMPLEILSDRLVRVWTHTHNTDIDIDLEVVDNEGNVQVQKISKSTHVESTLVNLVGMTNLYSVKVLVPKESRMALMERTEFKDCDQYNELTTFDFAVGEMDDEQINKATVCGKRDEIHALRLDENGLDLTKTHAFTKESVLSGLEIKVEIVDGMKDCNFRIEAKFNFVLMALKLQLSNEDEVVAVGAAELDSNRETSYDASTVIIAKNLPSGTYTLSLMLDDADVIAKNKVIKDVASYCLPFQLSIQASGTGSGPAKPTYALSPEQLDDLLPLTPFALTLTFTEPVTFESADKIFTITCECGDSKPCNKVGDKVFTLSLLRNTWEEGQTEVQFTFQEPDAVRPLRWGSTCSLKIADKSFKTASGEYFTPMFDCEATDKCKYTVPEGACEGEMCYSGGLCGSNLPSKCGFLCQKVEGVFLNPDSDGICPYVAPPATMIPTSEPVATQAVDTAVPTPHPTPLPTTVSPPTAVPTSVPTQVPLTTVPITPVPYTATPIRETKVPATPYPTIDEEKSSGISAGMVMVIMVVVIAAIAAVYTAWKKGYIATNKYRNPYGTMDAEFEDDDDNLFDDDDEDHPRPMEAVHDRTEV